jgi:hypothetical protein
MQDIIQANPMLYVVEIQQSMTAHLEYKISRSAIYDELISPVHDPLFSACWNS